MNHESLMLQTAHMPMKTIRIGGHDYLQRYFAGYSDSGGQHWLHRFLRGDSERHLHTHPFSASVMVLCGSYREEYMHSFGVIEEATYKTGAMRRLMPTTLHRIVDVEVDTWTLLHVSPGRLPTWAFIGDDGGETVMQSSPEDWHKGFGPRASGEAA